MNQRLTKLIAWLKQEQVDAAFITSPDNVFYLTGFHSDPHERLLALAVFPNAEPFLVCPKMEELDAKNAGWEHEILGYNDTDPTWELVDKFVQKRVNKVNTWAVEKEHLNVERYEELSQRFNGASFIRAEQILNELRMVKDEQEIALLKKACELADFAVQVGMNEIAEGKTELDIIAAIEYEVKKKGVSGMSFDTMVLTGANAAMPHGTPGLTKIKKGDLVLFDLGVIYEGYCSDITRTIAFGDISEEQARIYNTVLQAEETALKAVKPGMKASELDLMARKIIEDAGYGDFFPHRLGHGLGISVHEFPSMTATNDLELRSGMVFTIEPGIYVPNVAGVRIEDDVLVTENGVEVLTSFPKSLQIVE
ncbi:Xaa-Pro peptidase family protein [Bacillus sp. FJAT-50079]|uniref:M24 family metallopeptidase n=1 Tax=Bacillus sp. FJAT-50079 TaxID=2833577 RepID=UPI001BC9303F|nr:Xaa-Pro peptidase family protein [Bacillus sp. FJAT-50079]MBS4208773.1 aminopeptidase P family protein [Bacillus sp. FJAT-50079]